MARPTRRCVHSPLFTNHKPHKKPHGQVPFATAEAYRDLMLAAGNECELVGYPGQAHAFFHRNGYYEKTVSAMDDFLVKHGYLAPAAEGLVDALTEEAARH